MYYYVGVKQRGLTETILHTIVQKVETVLGYKELALTVFFGVEKAFDKARAAVSKESMDGYFREMRTVAFLLTCANS